ncbi:MAG TPA: polyketide synthase [Vicinamibacterales bacterium]|nr:polyketide synthase [Vicinamibacterales bacterium]
MISTQREGGIVVLTLEGPSQNALSEEFADALTGAVTGASADNDTKVIVLAGQDDVFCSGAPRELLVRLTNGDLRPADILLPKLLFDCPVPIVAAMTGHAVGGGFALGLAADIVLIARESRYGFTFMNLGFSPGMGVTRLCEHVLSPAVAHELLYTGELRRGDAFDRCGGINYVLPKGEVMPKALDVATRIAEKPRASIELLKRTLSLTRRRLFEETITLEMLMHQITLRSPGARRAIEDDYVE